jgi:hypothetical protein
MPIQAKSNFHPMGEKAESRESRNKRHPQEFKLVNLRIWGDMAVLTALVSFTASAASMLSRRISSRLSFPGYRPPFAESKYPRRRVLVTDLVTESNQFSNVTAFSLFQEPDERISASFSALVAYSFISALNFVALQAGGFPVGGTKSQVFRLANTVYLIVL